LVFTDNYPPRLAFPAARIRIRVGVEFWQRNWFYYHREWHMNSLTRRNVLKLGAAAAVVPLAVSAGEACPIIGSRRSCSPTPCGVTLRECCLTVKPSGETEAQHKHEHVVYIGGVAYHERKKPYTILAQFYTEFDTQGKERVVCMLPWAPHVLYECDAYQGEAPHKKPFTRLEFQSECQDDKTANPHCHVLWKFNKVYGPAGECTEFEGSRPFFCVIICGSNEYQVAKGDCITCDGVQKCC
jgi:hypothetical protein